MNAPEIAAGTGIALCLISILTIAVNVGGIKESVKHLALFSATKADLSAITVSVDMLEKSAATKADMNAITVSVDALEKTAATKEDLEKLRSMMRENISDGLQEAKLTISHETARDFKRIGECEVTHHEISRRLDNLEKAASN